MNVSDRHHNSKEYLAFKVYHFVSNQTFIGEIVDTAEGEAAELVFTVEKVNSGNLTLTLYESNDSGMVGETEVVSPYRLGGELLTTTNLHTRMGYIGKKRYIRVTAKSSVGASLFSFAGVLLLVNTKHQPTVG